MVVLVHGVLMDASVWRNVVPALAPHARVITLVVNDWGGPLFLITEGRDERVGRLVVTPCEAYKNFPPGLPERVATIGTRYAWTARMAMRMFRVGWIRRTPLMFGWMARRAVPDEFARAWTEPALTDPGVLRDLMAYASSHQDAAANIASTEGQGGLGARLR